MGIKYGYGEVGLAEASHKDGLWTGSPNSADETSVPGQRITRRRAKTSIVKPNRQNERNQAGKTLIQNSWNVTKQAL